MSIFLSRRGLHEETCVICGRRHSFGFTPDARKPIAWVCDYDCLPAARKVYNMAPKKLDIYEERAIERATAASIDPIFCVLLNALHAGGVRKMDDLADQEGLYQKIADEAAKSEELREALTGFLEAFGKSIREQIGSGEAPF
jgi:hypothetical protein